MRTAMVEGNAWELTKMVPPCWWRSLQGMWKLIASHDWQSSLQTWLQLEARNSVAESLFCRSDDSTTSMHKSMFTRFELVHLIFWCTIYVCWIWTIKAYTSTFCIFHGRCYNDERTACIPQGPIWMNVEVENAVPQFKFASETVFCVCFIHVFWTHPNRPQVWPS